jgi:hypothetical protein
MAIHDDDLKIFFNLCQIQAKYFTIPESFISFIDLFEGIFSVLVNSCFTFTFVRHCYYSFLNGGPFDCESKFRPSDDQRNG